MPPTPIRVLIADDHPLLLEGLRHSLASTSIQIVGTARSFAEIPQLLKSTTVDVLVLDLGGMGGAPLSFVHGIRREHPETRVLVLSSTVDLAPEMIQAGVLGYAAKGDMVDQRQIINAVLTVAAGQPWYSTVVTEYLERANGVQTTLAPKELSVLKLLAQGKNNVEISQEVGLDPRTVQNYITAMRRKTGCEERTQLVNWYRRTYEGGS